MPEVRSPTLAPTLAYRALDVFQLSDLESIRLILRGGSVIDWHRLNFESEDSIHEFIFAQEIDFSDPVDRQRTETVKAAAIAYLRRNFDFPIPRPVEQADLPGLLRLASSKGHRQLCTCIILKVMHIIHHLEARELLFMLPVSSQELFHMVEQKIYQVMGAMLASGLPILEFIGGRKHKDSLYTKLLSKQETLAAQIYDKLRFRVVTRTVEDVFLVLHCLTRYLFPFNYVIPGESTNTLMNFQQMSLSHGNLRKLYPRLQLAPEVEQHALDQKIDNRFSSSAYRTVHFVVDMPVRLSQEFIEKVPASAKDLGRVIFVQVEFQMVDRQTEQVNEQGDASHEAYKRRQKVAVMRRLKLGSPIQPPRRRRMTDP